MSVRFTEAVRVQRFRILDLNNKGTPIRRIAEMLNVDPRTVRRVLRKAGKDHGAPGRPPAIPHSHVPRLWADYLGKKITVKDIANEYGISEYSVRRVLRDYKKKDVARFFGDQSDDQPAEGAGQGDTICDGLDSEE